MKLAMFTLAAAAAFALTTATAEAAKHAAPLNMTYDRLAPRTASLSENGTTNAALDQIADRRGRYYYRSYPQRYYYQPHYPSYRYQPSYRYYNSYPRYYDGYRGRYYDNYRGGVGIYGRNFSFGIDF